MFNRLEYGKEWRKKNREYAKKYNKENWKKYYTEEKKEKARKYSKMYREKNPEVIKEYCKSNIRKIKEWHKIYYEKNREKLGRQSKMRKQENKERNRECENHRRRTNLKVNINHRMTTAIRTSLQRNKNGRKWEGLVGYTVNVLIKRLQKTIPKGYTWQDFLEGRLHIDHIIPKNVFNYTKPEHPDFQRCWALNNLQLLPARENLLKGDKLEKAFQPALRLIEEVV